MVEVPLSAEVPAVIDPCMCRRYLVLTVNPSLVSRSHEMSPASRRRRNALRTVLSDLTSISA